MKKIRNRKDLQITDLMIAHGPAGYGVYVMLTQYLSERKSLRRREDIARIAYELHAEAEMVRSVLEDFGLFFITDEGEFANEAPKPKPAPEPSKIPEPSESSEPSEDSECAKSPNSPKSLNCPKSPSPLPKKPARKTHGQKISAKKLLSKPRGVRLIERRAENKAS